MNTHKDTHVDIHMNIRMDTRMNTRMDIRTLKTDLKQHCKHRKKTKKQSTATNTHRHRCCLDLRTIASHPVQFLLLNCSLNWPLTSVSVLAVFSTPLLFFVIADLLLKIKITHGVIPGSGWAQTASSKVRLCGSINKNR